MYQARKSKYAMHCQNCRKPSRSVRLYQYAPHDTDWLPGGFCCLDCAKEYVRKQSEKPLAAAYATGVSGE